MINSISCNRFSNTQFRAKWINTQAVSVHKKQGANMIDELIKKMVEELKVKAKDPNNLPQHGKFNVVWSEFENKDKTIDATHCLLKISNIGVRGCDDQRYLEVAAVKRGTQYGAESVIGYGTTNEILDRLNEQGIEQIIKEKFIKLAKDLDDV